MPVSFPASKQDNVQTLSRFESNLCHILYAMLGDSSGGHVMSKVYQKHAYPGCLSRASVELVQQALAKGMTHWLASQGGWRSERNLRDEKVVAGPIWQRTKPADLGLTFSAASLRLLIWLTANDPREDTADPGLVLPQLAELTVGDQLLVLRMLVLFKDKEFGARWFRMRWFATQPLVALCFPDQIAMRERPVTLELPTDMDDLLLVLECLQPFLTRRWVEVEEGKAFIREIEEMRKLGQQQATLLEALLDRLSQAGRRDVARFLLVAMQQLVANELPPQQWARRWIRSLQLGGLRLAERTIVYQSASCFLAVAEHLQAWTAQCRQVGYFDEGYAAAQLWLADWENYDSQNTTSRALAMVRSLTV